MQNDHCRSALDEPFREIIEQRENRPFNQFIIMLLKGQIKETEPGHRVWSLTNLNK